MIGFRTRFKAALDRSEYRKNIAGLAKDAGCSKSSVYGLVDDERLDHSKTGPGLFAMARVAPLLGVTLDHMAGIAPPPIKAHSNSCPASPLIEHANATLRAQIPLTDDRPTSDSVLRLYAKSGGRIEAFDHLLDYCDKYECISETSPQMTVISVGANTLAAITMGHNDASILEQALRSTTDESLKRKWINDYSEAARRGTLTTIETLDVQMPNQPTRVKMDFVRVLICVSDADANRSVLNFSFLIV